LVYDFHLVIVHPRSADKRECWKSWLLAFSSLVVRMENIRNSGFQAIVRRVSRIFKHLFRNKLRRIARVGARRIGPVADCGLSRGSGSARVNPFGHASVSATRARAVEPAALKRNFAGKDAA
jgi:hypothetical protein